MLLTGRDTPRPATAATAASTRRRPVRTDLRMLGLGTGVLLRAAASRAGSVENAYVQTNLVSDRPGTALVRDPQLVNPWGLSTSATSPLWTANEATGSS